MMLATNLPHSSCDYLHQMSIKQRRALKPSMLTIVAPSCMFLIDSTWRSYTHFRLQGQAIRFLTPRKRLNNKHSWTEPTNRLTPQSPIEPLNQTTVRKWWAVILRWSIRDSRTYHTHATTMDTYFWKAYLYPNTTHQINLHDKWVAQANRIQL